MHLRTYLSCALLAAASLASPAFARTLHVGPNGPLRTIAEAASQVQDGDIVEVEAGTYRADVAVWSRNNVTVRGIPNARGKQARIIADGAQVQGKGTWVVNGDMTIENLAFIGARVPDGNGAGIRLQKGRVRIVHCLFEDNQNGILVANDPSIELTIENSEFGHNGAGDGRTHNIYVGAIGKLRVVGSYFHHAKVGHLLKSRAAENYILYNRLTDEVGGSASYELEFPNGGVAYVIGNVIEQGAKTENPHVLAFGAEGYKWPNNALFLSHNTVIDGRGGSGVFLRIRPGYQQFVAVNNVLSGNSGKLESLADPAAANRFANNVYLPMSAFADVVDYNYRLTVDVVRVVRAQASGKANEMDLTPDQEYQHPLQTRPLKVAPTVPGALQPRTE